MARGWYSEIRDAIDPGWDGWSMVRGDCLVTVLFRFGRFRLGLSMGLSRPVQRHLRFVCAGVTRARKVTGGRRRAAGADSPRGEGV